MSAPNLLIIKLCLIGLISCNQAISNESDFVSSKDVQENSNTAGETHLQPRDSYDTLKRIELGSGLAVYYTKSKDAQEILFTNGKNILNRQPFPRQDEVSGISLNYFKKMDDDLVISFEYGSVNYFNKNLYFRLNDKTNPFQLYRIETDSFNKHSPEDWHHTDTVLKAKIPIKNFNITNYINN